MYANAYPNFIEGSKVIYKKLAQNSRESGASAPKTKKQKELLSYTRSSCSYAIASFMTSFEKVVFFCHQGRQSDGSMLSSRVPEHPSVPVLPYSIADHAD
jgi:hypothetical protein